MDAATEKEFEIVLQMYGNKHVLVQRVRQSAKLAAKEITLTNMHTINVAKPGNYLLKNVLTKIFFSHKITMCFQICLKYFEIHI